jgi:carbon monoxide dehydrogenase subunit G
LPPVPSRTFSHSVKVDAPREVVWAALEEPETWEAISGVDRVHDAVVDREGRLQGFSFEATAAGQVYPGLATPHAREESRVMAWAIDTSEVEGVTRVELADEGEGTRCTVTVEVESRTILSSVLFPMIASAIGSGLPAAVDAFAAELGGSAQSS